MNARTLLLLSFLAPVLAPAQPSYHAVALPANDPSGNRLNYVAVNNNNQTVATSNSFGGHGFLTNIYLVNSDGSMQLLDSGGNNIRVYALNDSGVVVGSGQSGGINVGLVFSAAMVNNPEALTNLSGISNFGIANAINNNNQIGGYSDTDSGPSAAVRWSLPSVSAQFWGFAGDNGTICQAINSSGVETGYYIAHNSYQPAQFNNGVATTYPFPVGFTSGQSVSINDSNAATGYIGGPSGAYAARFTTGGTTPLPGLPLQSAGNRNDYGASIDAAGDVLGNTSNAAPDARNHSWIYWQGSTYDLGNVTDLAGGGPWTTYNMCAGGTILAFANSGGYYLLEPLAPPSNVTITVAQRVDGGTVPDGTTVQLLNNDGTQLSPPTSGTTSSGSVVFTNPPAPTAPNTSYEVKVQVPSGAKGLPAIQNNVALGATTVYFTDVVPSVTQALTGAPPVAFASFTVSGITEYTNTVGVTAGVWLPDGSYTPTFSMSPGRPCTPTLVLGASSSSRLVAESNYVSCPANLTRIYLTARNSNGTTFIPFGGAWGITPGSISGATLGHSISQSWWLPNGTYSGSLSGASENGTSSFNVGNPTASGLRTITVN